MGAPLRRGGVAVALVAVTMLGGLAVPDPVRADEPAEPVAAQFVAPPSPRCAPTAALPEVALTEAPPPQPIVPAPTGEVAARETESRTYSAPDTARRMIPGQEYRSPVTLTNTTALPFVAANQVLSYHWSRATPTGPVDDVATTTDRRETRLPADLAPGASVLLDALIAAPALADVGNEREQFILRWDVYDTATRTWLSDTAQVPTLDQDVRVENPTSDQLGLESFYNYTGAGTGAGGNLSVNQFSGNAVWGYDAFSNPGRGVASFLRVNHNSEDASTAYGGAGWSVAASTLNRLGTPLAFDGLLPGLLWANSVTLTDGDGTSHTWELNQNGSLDRADWRYESPAGVHLYLQHLPDNPAERRWLFTSPERTQFFFDTEGYHTATVDKNGNTMSFTYDRVIIGNRNTGLLRHVTDATGRRTLTLDYYQAAQSAQVITGDVAGTVENLTNALIVNQLRSVTDVSGRVVSFVYSDVGQLRELVDGVNDPGVKRFSFFYGLTGELIRVVDPLGRSTGVEYVTDLADPSQLGNVRTIVDRRGFRTTMAYRDPDGTSGPDVETTMVDGNGQPTMVRLDGFGRMTAMTDALGRTTRLVWDGDNNVVRLTENNGATQTWAYDERTGFPLEIRDAEAVRADGPATRLGYRTELEGYIADLTEKTTPEGRRWVFGYDPRGNLTSVTDPKGTVTPAADDFTSRYTYDEFGQLVDQTDANEHTTVYGEYDPNGYPQVITDALGCTTRYRYDIVGNVVSTRDARGKSATYTYDLFKRPLDSTEPKDQDAGVMITTPGPRYDANDNVLTSTDARGSVTRTLYDEMDQPVGVYAPSDTPDGPDKLTTTVYDAVGNVIRATQPKGNLTGPIPDDFTVTMRYDHVNQVVESVDVNGDRVTAAYDDVGNLVTEFDERKNRTPDPNDFTTRYAFDLNHQTISTTDALGHTVRTRYDRDGNVIGSTDELGNETLVTLDERAMQVEVRSPHNGSGGSLRYFTTRYEYDEVGNLTRTVNPRGVDTPNVADDFVSQTVYDELNRPREQILPFDPNDAEHRAPVSSVMTYDELGRVIETSAPPSRGSSTRVVTRQTYFDNGWVRTSTDPFDIRTAYDYTDTGQQSLRTISGSGGTPTREMSWSYYPDGKLRARSDSGVPLNRETVVVDNADTSRVTATAGWRTAQSARGFQGPDYSTIQTTSATELFAWRATIPATGRYDVQVWYPEGTATNATYFVEHNGGFATVPIDQNQRRGEWVSLGAYEFGEGQTRNIVLAGRANGTVAADAVRLVRNDGVDPDDTKVFEHFYDVNDNLVRLTDSTPDTPADTWEATYDEVNLADSVRELSDGQVRHTSTYRYDENDNLVFSGFDDTSAEYTYDARDLLASVLNRREPGDAGDTTTFTYTPRGHIQREVKGNGNVVDFTYHLDGLLQRQTERRRGSQVIVADHQMSYDSNSNVIRDAGRMQNADDGGSETFAKDYTYDPRDRVRRVGLSGVGGDRSEEYRHDDNGNVYDQTIDDVRTEFTYDRNRLSRTVSEGQTANYGYDGFGRLERVTASGMELERYTYDGFDRRIEHARDDGERITRYTYDPLDRQLTTVEDAEGDATTTTMNYLGLSQQVITEEEDGELSRIYNYGPDGEMLGQVRIEDGDETELFVGFNTHADVEQLTGEDGNTTSTYGYTAFGRLDPEMSMGEDKPDPADPDKPELNPYRFNTARHDRASDSYDMGFRDYSPGINRFLTLDLYNGALTDLGMSIDPWTNNRYSFGSGNPLSQVEIDGHGWWDDAGNWLAENAATIGHAALDVAGLIPVIGEAADLANAAWYLAEGDYTNAALSAAAAIPFAGYAATAVKAGRYAVKGAEATQATSRAAGGTTAGANTAARAAEAGTNGTRTAPTPKPAPKPAGPSMGQGSGNGGGPAGGTISTGRTPAGGGSGGGPAANGGGTSATRNTDGNTGGGGGGGSCAVNSFVPGTQVLLADGSTAPIEDVALGDLVVATDPETGEQFARPVIALITGEGVKQLVEITIDTDGAEGDATASVTATDGHPFWVDQQGRWIDAGQLQAGDWLLTDTGERQLVVSIRAWTQEHQRVHNLTIAGTHTYHVTAGTSAPLTHNQNDPCGNAGGNGDGYTSPGPHAGESIPARGPQQRFNSQERAEINRIGGDTGCHACGTTDPGTKSRNFVPDHQPPTRMNPSGAAQQLFPHCLRCSLRQGGLMRMLGGRI